MSSHPEGLKIARARIAEEKENRTGFLDLGMLGLKEWPEELWELEHLEGLNLGEYWTDLEGERHSAAAYFGGNDFPWDQAKWNSMPTLRLLSFGGSIQKSTFSDLKPLADLSALQTLNCSGTEMIIWGGSASGGVTDSGALYNPVTDSWRTMNATGAPRARQFHSAVWTGTSMIIFGGDPGTTGELDEGGIYTPGRSLFLYQKL